MTEYYTKLIAVCIMVVALTGQALAYVTMSCDMTFRSVEQNNTSHDHSTMSHDMKDDHSNHAGMHHADMMHGDKHAHAQNNGTQHCGADCQCPEGTCGSLFYLSSVFLNVPEALPDSKFMLPSQEHLNTSLSSLYRPPIIA